MCRITAIVEFKKNIDYNIHTVIESMRDTMYKGGPDDAGKYIHQQDNYSLAFGHRRLSIIDVSANGHQPMLSEDGNFIIIFNGEIYNYEEIRNELIAKGVQFKTHSDTEVIIKAYQHSGIECINSFVGMFAFILFDKVRDLLYVVRDRAGIKPLYYYSDNEFILFGSELKSFHKHPEFKKQINVDATALYLQLGYIPAPHSIFLNAKKVMPGHYLKINLVTKEIVDNVYWDVIKAYQQPLLNNLSTEDILQKTESLLTSACNYRMVADVPIGVFLSGGYDSSLVTALLQKDSTAKIKTFSIGFEEAEFNEAEHAKKVALHLGTEHTEYYCTHQDALKIIPDLPEIYDEPFGDSSAIPTILVSEIARQSVKVALSADAGDEVFGGYEKYTGIITLQQKLNKFPYSLKKLAGKMINVFNPESLFASSVNNNLSKRAEKFARILQAKNMGEELFWLSTLKTKYQLKHIIQKPFEDLSTNFNLSEAFSANADNINTMLAVDYATYLPDDILAKVDRATMSVSLEGREPLLDHRLVEWMAQIPGSRKINGGVKKFFLKEIVHRYIPVSIMDRPKMGFGVPIALWFKNELKEYFEYYLSDEVLKQHNLFEINYVQQKKQQFYDGNTSVVTELWYFLMFQMWYEKWMKE